MMKVTSKDKLNIKVLNMGSKLNILTINFPLARITIMREEFRELIN